MGTSLSGLTPATTFDGLLKVGDNDPLTADLKAISTGDGTDTILSLSNSALQIGGATGMYWDNTNKRLGLNDTTPTSRIDIKNTFGASSLAQLDRMGMFVGYLSATFGLALGGASSTNSGTIQGTNNAGNAPSTLSLNPFGGNVGILDTQATARLHIKGSGATSATTSLLVQNSAGSDLLKVADDGAVSATTFYAGTSIIRQNSFRINQQWLVSGAGGQGLKIGTSNTAPDNSAKLEVDSTTQGFLPPRMTQAQRDAITTPAAGLMIYNTDTNTAECWNTSAWMPMF